MLRSLSSAISGLQNHQTKLDVVGNNIANVNTVGYKAEAARFQEIFSQTLRGGTAPFAGRGGVNPMQVGLGMSLSSINTNHTQGSIESTGQEADMAIEGSGFFVVSDGDQNFFTRDGSFNRDSAGYLTNANGMRLMGWLPGEDDEIDTSQELSDMNIPLGEDMIAQATEEMVFSGNLNAAARADVNYHAEGFMEGLAVNGLPEGGFSVSYNEDAGEAGARQIATNSGVDFLAYDEDGEALYSFQDDVEDNIMHYIEVNSKTDDYVLLDVVEMNKFSGERETIENVRLEYKNDFDTDDYPAAEGYELSGEIGSVNFDEEGYISPDIAQGDRFIIDYFDGEDDGITLSATSGIADGQEIAFHGDFEDANDQNLFTMHMNERTGEIFFGSLNADIDIDNEDVDDFEDAVTFNFEPHLYDSYLYDSLGNRHELKVSFTKHPKVEGDGNKWSYSINAADPTIELENNTGIVAFTPGGRFDADASEINAFEVDGPDLCTDAEDMEVMPDFADLVQLSETSNAFIREQDGFAAGELSTFEVEESGVVTGVYTNGMMKTLGQISLASFSNPEGLQKLGNNLYDITANSGDARIGVPGEMGRGMIQARSLEMSNVDLSREFTEMITTNRAFQANTRMITTSDEVLTELVNMKR